MRGNPSFYSRFVLAMLVALVFSSVAFAQQASGIAGVVRDSSGAVLPGVSVEAASPALIEKVRTAVTDGEGRFNIVDLRPGTYSVTFSLAGFNTFKRDAVALTAGFTATVNADLRVGALEETITVTSSSPLVDLQNVRQQESLSNELIDALPSGSKGFMGIARLVPGMNGNGDGGGASGIYSANSAHASTVHGKGGGKMAYDGMQTSNQTVLGNSSYIMNPATVEETVVLTGAISAESDASGIYINLVPKEGGNTFRGGTDGMYTNGDFQSDNLTDDVRSRGVTTINKVQHLYDTNFYIGGPIKRDRVWFFAATRATGSQNQVSGVYFNATQGTPLYTPDLDRPAFRREWLRSQGERVTWQLSPRNKINAFGDTQSYQTRGRGQFTAPEAHSVWSFWPNGLYQVTWSSPVTQKVLLEAGFSFAQNGYPSTREQSTDIFGFVVKETDVATTEASTGFQYNARPQYQDKNDQNRYVQRFSASYVTGSHNFKTGFQLQQGVLRQHSMVNQDVRYTFTRGVPTSLDQLATPYSFLANTRAELGIFAQDQWKLQRLTLSVGVRFDYFNGYVPAQAIPATRFLPARSFGEVRDVPNWKDLNPRVGGAYDLFGDGRTAVKASIGRYVGKMSTAVATANNPINTSINSVNRTWTDANQNYVPDCNLQNFDLNGECGPINNRNFGQQNPNAVRYADDLIRGWDTRDYLWDLTTEVQHQLTPRISVKAGWNRNWTTQFGDLFTNPGTNLANGGWPTGVTDNQAVTPVDFQTYCITAPNHPQLPGGGGYQICGLYDIVPAKFGQGSQVVTRASNFGDGKSRVSNFVTGSVSTRLGGGRELGASIDTGRIVEDNCFVVDSPQSLLFCHVVAPFSSQTQVKAYWSLPLPAAFAVSGVVQNLAGTQRLATYQAPNALIAPSLGRNLAACGTRVECTSTATVPLIAPMSEFEPRRTQIDLRLTKVFQLSGRIRVRANLDLYNALNDGSVVNPNTNFGSSWLQPTGGFFTGGLADGRLLQFSGQLTF